MKRRLAIRHDTARAMLRPTGWGLALALLCIGLSGCKTDPNILALERENRVLDDQVWYLSDQLDITLQKLESAKAKLAKCQDKLKDKDSDATSTGERTGSGRSATGGPSLFSKPSGKKADVPEEISQPEIVLPSEALPPGQMPKSLQRGRSGSSRFGDPGEERPAREKNGAKRPAADTPAAEKPAAEKPTNDKSGDEKPSADKPGPDATNNDKPANVQPGEIRPAGITPPRMLNPPARKLGTPMPQGPRSEQFSAEPARLPAVTTAAVAIRSGKPYRVIPTNALSIETSADSSAVQSITLHRLLTGGLNVDGQPGDEGITVVIEPRDAQGKLVAASGAVSVLALDPALPGDRARVARWDLAPGEVAPMFRRLPLGASGLSLELLWPGEPPRNGRLDLFVLFRTSDGRDLEARGQLNITPPASATGAPMAIPASATDTATPIREAPDSAGAGQASSPRASRPTWSPNRS